MNIWYYQFDESKALNFDFLFSSHPLMFPLIMLRKLSFKCQQQAETFFGGEGGKGGLGMLFTDRRDKIFIKQSEATHVFPEDVQVGMEKHRK